MKRDQAAREPGEDGASRDGRTRRSERSREAIATALYDLVGEGIPEPTAQQVADRAGVGIRSVFRHFADIEALYTTLDARLLEETLPLRLGDPPEGSVAKRVREFVRKRAALFDRIAPYKRASNLKRWRSPFLSSQHTALVRQLRRDLLRWLPELEDAPDEVVEALDQLSSFEAWDRLRSEQRLGRERAAKVVERALLALLRDREGAG